MPQRNSRALRSPAAALCGVGLLYCARTAHANVFLHDCGYNTTYYQPNGVFVIYWNGTSSDPYSNQAFDTNFLASAFSSLYSSPGLPGTPYLGALTQYYSTSCTGGSPAYIENGIFNVPPMTGVRQNPPSSTPTCMQELNMVDNVAGSYAFNTPVVFVVQLGEGISISAVCCNGGCGCHTWTSAGNAFMEIPYYSPSGPPGCGPLPYDGLSSVLDHELAEMMTDPFGNDIGQQGWNGGSTATEVGDLCELNPNGTYALQTVQVLPTGTAPAYAVDVQPLWSNVSNGGAGACVYSYEPDESTFFLDGSGNISFAVDHATAPSTWASSTELRGAPAIAHWGPYRYDVFGFGSSGRLRHRYQVGYPGSGFVSTGGDDWGYPPTGDAFITAVGGFAVGPSVASWGSARLDVFADVTTSGADNILHRAWDNGTDSGWLTYLGIPSGAGTPASSPAAVSPIYGRIDVFVLMSNGNVYQTTCTDAGCTSSSSFSAWTSIGHPSTKTLQGSPAAASWGATYSNTNGGTPPRIDIFFVNTAGSLSHWFADHSNYGNTPPGAWDYWNPPTGTTAASSPAATGLGDMRIAVSAIGSTGTNLLVWNLDWGTVTSASIPLVVPSGTTGTAMTYGYPGYP